MKTSLFLVSVLLCALIPGVRAKDINIAQPIADLLLNAPDLRQTKPCPVKRVIDGDTIVVDQAGTEVKVRLIGVDTPETVHPSKPVEHYGKEASRFTENLLKGERVKLVADTNQVETDRYGRTLAYVYRFPDGLFVNAEIIRQGYGHAYTSYPFKFMEAFRQLEQFARNAGKGLWESANIEEKPTAETTTPPVRKRETKPRELPRKRVKGNWYEGGTLHGAGALTWQEADHKNKLATCADFVAVQWKEKNFKPSIQNTIKTVDDMRPYALELLTCLDGATEKHPDPQMNHSMYANQTVAGMAAICMAMMGWMR